MKKLLTIYLILLSSLNTFAGDNGGGSMECRSASGRTKISATGVATYNGSGTLAVKVTIDNKSLDLGTGQANHNSNVIATGVTVFEPKHKVYTAVINLVGEAGRFDYSAAAFEMAAIPSSFRALPNDQFSFDAVVRTIDPRQPQTDYPVMVDNQIQVSCKMDQSI